MKFCKSFFLIYIASSLLFFAGCRQNKNSLSNDDVQNQLKEILETQLLNGKQKYEIVNQMATNLLSEKDYQGVILLLTNWVEQNPDDIYNAYWLLMTAHSYMEMKAEPIAEYYFDKILKKYPDLYIKGKSAHFICLQNLIQISKTPSHRITYFNDLIKRFPQEVNTTELYFRLALEYEKDNQWEQVLRTYKLYLQQPDASLVQIPGEPDAYKNARRIIDFNNSSKDWTYESLHELETAIRKAIRSYDWYTLDKMKAKVNFFTMSWKQDEIDTSDQEEFSMYNWIHDSDNIKCSDTLDESSNSSEAYLRTWGWNGNVPVWYFYFRKIDFPINPEINGNWEWAGIYLGNKL